MPPLPFSATTYQRPAVRTNDSSRVARGCSRVFNQHEKVGTDARSVDQRACLVRRGLQDRKTGVREAAQQLLCAWLDSDAGSSVPSLLHALDVRRHEPEAELAVRCLLQKSPTCDLPNMKLLG